MRLHISMSKRDSIRNKLRNGKIIKNKVDTAMKPSILKSYCIQ
jgi:hypothetical protein